MKFHINNTLNYWVFPKEFWKKTNNANKIYLLHKCYEINNFAFDNNFQMKFYSSLPRIGIPLTALNRYL